MSVIRHFRDAYAAFRTDSTSSDQYVADPGASGTFDLRGRDNAYAIIPSGTRLLPDNIPRGVRFTIYATGNVTITSAASVTIATLTTGQYAEFRPLTATTWAAQRGVTGAGGTGAAALVGFADGGDLTAAVNVETALQQALSDAADFGANALTTVGAGTLTAALMVRDLSGSGTVAGGIIVRSGSLAAFTDTTATASAIITALGGNRDSQGRLLFIKNTTNFAETLAAGTDVTLAGQTIIPANTTGVFDIQVTSFDSATVTITGIALMPNCRLTNGQYNTTAAASPVTPAAGILTGANHVFYEVTTDGAFGITTRTAGEMYGDIPNCHIGFTYLLTIVNRGNNTITITAGGSVTITASENTLATLVTRTYLVNFTSATACTWTSLSKGTIET